MKKVTVKLKEIIHFKDGNGGGSDLSLKQDVSEITAGLEEILALRPVSWKWRNPDLALAEETSVSDGDLQYGFIAQDVEKVFPQLVRDGLWQDNTVKKFLTPTGLIPYLVLAIQQQQAQIKELTDSKSAKEQ